MSGLRHVRSLVQSWRPLEGGWGADGSAVVASAWAEAVGAEVARRTRPGTLRDGVLTVYTASSTWSHQLTFLAPTILAELAQRCPDPPVARLRFLVASGRVRALLEGNARRAGRAARATPSDAPAPLDDVDERAEDIVARLRRRQHALDRRRANSGWTRCPVCASWRAPSTAAGDACAACAQAAQRARDLRVEGALSDAPWLRADEVGAHVAGASAAAYERARARLLGRWEEQLRRARRRLRRGELEPADRMTAWSVLMLRTRTEQRSIGRAVIADALGEEWACALLGDAKSRRREAHASGVQKQRNTTARAHTRGDTT